MCGNRGRDELCNRCKDAFEDYQASKEYQWDLEEEVEVWLRDPDSFDLSLDILEKELRDTDLYEFFFGENRELVMDKIKANVIEQCKKYVTDTVDKRWWNDDDY